jgi:hypothetical protein
MFVLRIRVTRPALDMLKLALIKSLPDVKSSHRVEALGRGLGFQTYAALLAATQTTEAPLTSVSGERFQHYLQEHGFSADPRPLYLAAARVAINEVLQAIPHLHVFGIGFPRPHRTSEGRWQTSQERYSAFTAHRDECLGDRAGGAFLRSLAFLAIVKRTTTVRAGTGSYRLKHVAEKFACTYPEGQKLGPDYVPNGMLIAAAVHLGYSYRTSVDELGYSTLNATFNMSKPVIDDLDAQVRGREGSRVRRRAFRYAETRIVSGPASPT